MIRVRRRGTQEAESGHEAAGMMRWLLTYADMITLLMAFFIMMFAISYFDSKKFEAVMHSLHEVFGGRKITTVSGPGLNTYGGLTGMNPIIVQPPEFSLVEQNIEDWVERGGYDDHVFVHRSERGLIVRFLSEGLLFNLGEADLSNEGKRALRELTAIISPLKSRIRVEGHTCDLPIRTIRFPSNWELSAGRASAVVRFLVQEDVNTNRLSTAGYGEFRPFLPNTSRDNRRLNRRVDIVLLTGVAEDEEPVEELP